MNFLSTCPYCGGPVLGSLLNSGHKCKPTPYKIIYQAPVIVPDKSSPQASDLADNITPGEATRLCSLILEQIEEHRNSCKWCQMLKEQDLMCLDGLAMRDTLKKWEQHTLIEKDKHEQ